MRVGLGRVGSIDSARPTFLSFAPSHISSLSLSSAPAFLRINCHNTRQRFLVVVLFTQLALVLGLYIPMSFRLPRILAFVKLKPFFHSTTWRNAYNHRDAASHRHAQTRQRVLGKHDPSEISRAGNAERNTEITEPKA